MADQWKEVLELHPFDHHPLPEPSDLRDHFLDVPDVFHAGCIPDRWLNILRHSGALLNLVPRTFRGTEFQSFRHMFLMNRSLGGPLGLGTSTGKSNVSVLVENPIGSCMAPLPGMFATGSRTNSELVENGGVKSSGSLERMNPCQFLLLLAEFRTKISGGGLHCRREFRARLSLCPNMWLKWPLNFTILPQCEVLSSNDDV